MFPQLARECRKNLHNAARRWASARRVLLQQVNNISGQRALFLSGLRGTIASKNQWLRISGLGNHPQWPENQWLTVHSNGSPVEQNETNGRERNRALALLAHHSMEKEQMGRGNVLEGDGY